MGARIAISTALAALALAACSISGGKSPIPTPTLSSAAPAEKAEEILEPWRGPRPEATTEPMDECSDPSGDGGPVDLGSVTLYASRTEVTAVFDLTKPLPKTDTAIVGVVVSSADGKIARQLTVKWIDGKTPGPFVFDLRTAKQDNLAPDKVLEKGSQYIVAFFPGSATADLGKSWKWSAFANAAGNDTDACPGPAGSMQYQPFAGKTEKVDLD